MATARLYPASLNTAGGLRWGYIDGSGATAIRPRYDDAQDFQPNGLAVVAENGKYGVIDQAARYVVAPVYDSIAPFAERRAVAIDVAGFRLLDEAGSVVTKRAYPFIADMREGRAVFYTSPGGENGPIRYGYLDARGDEAIPARYEEAGDFRQGRAVVKIADGSYALIDPDGRVLASYTYAYVGQPGDGLLPFRQQADGTVGYIDERGQVVIPPSYTSAFPFRDGRAIVNTAEQFADGYGVIDKRGAFVVEAAYNDVRDLGERRLALGRAIDPARPYIGSMYAIAEWNGKRLTDFRYRDVTDFRNGLASATDGRRTYVIDRSGNPAPGYPRADGSGTLTVEEDGLIKSFVDRRLSYLDRAGRIVWKWNTIIPLRPPYAVREEKYKPNEHYLVYYPRIEGMAGQAAQRAVNDRLRELAQVKPVPTSERLEYSYDGDFEVAFYRGSLLELRLDGYRFPFGAAHGMPSRTYAIVDLRSGRMYALRDLFRPGSDYAERLGAIVGALIRDDPQYAYVWPDSFTGIRPDQPFYVTEDALHLYFEPYEIAPYAAGFPTFTIPFERLGNLIDTEGPFWQSFHG